MKNNSQHAEKYPHKVPQDSFIITAYHEMAEVSKMSQTQTRYFFVVTHTATTVGLLLSDLREIMSFNLNFSCLLPLQNSCFWSSPKV